MTGNDECAILVQRILLLAVTLALVIAGVGWFFVSAGFALSVTIGAVLACGSFFLLQRDVRRLMEHVAATAGSAGGMLPKLGFFVKALGRFVILALVLFTVANKINIQPLGLVLGLVTIMVSTVVLGLLRKRERLSDISD